MVSQQMAAKLLDVFERAGWTFVQALAGTIYVAGSATDFYSINWTAALTGAAWAAGLAVLKFLGINASQALQGVIGAVMSSPADPAAPAPAAEVLRRHER